MSQCPSEEENWWLQRRKNTIVQGTFDRETAFQVSLRYRDRPEDPLTVPLFCDWIPYQCLPHWWGIPKINCVCTWVGGWVGVGGSWWLMDHGGGGQSGNQECNFHCNDDILYKKNYQATTNALPEVYWFTHFFQWSVWSFRLPYDPPTGSHYVA